VPDVRLTRPGLGSPDASAAPIRDVSEGDTSWMGAALASGEPSPGLVSRTSGTVRAYWRGDVTFRARSLDPGWYVYAVRLAAAMNPGRTSLLVGSPFRVR